MPTPQTPVQITKGLSLWLDEKRGSRQWQDIEADRIVVNGEFSVSLVIARCIETPTGLLRWNLHFDTSLAPDITIVARMDRANRAPFDFYLFPRIDMLSEKLRLGEDNALGLDAYRFDGLDLTVREGELFALLGTNGAGKTTALETIQGLRQPDGGAVTVLGLDIAADRAAAMSRCGVMLQETGYADELTVRETVGLLGALSGRDDDPDRLLDLAGLVGRRDVRVGQLSGGERQRVAVHRQQRVAFGGRVDRAQPGSGERSRRPRGRAGRADQRSRAGWMGVRADDRLDQGGRRLYRRGRKRRVAADPRQRR